jgi:hypothetical protein
MTLREKYTSFPYEETEAKEFAQSFTVCNWQRQDLNQGLSTLKIPEFINDPLFSTIWRVYQILFSFPITTPFLRNSLLDCFQKVQSQVNPSKKLSTKVPYSSERNCST